MNGLQPAVSAGLCGLVLCAGLAGCGLKGSLSLPESAGNVVIRDQQPGGTPGGQGAPAKPAEPEKLPPPELPRSNGGSPR